MKVYRRPRLSSSRRTTNDPVAYVRSENLQQAISGGKRLTFRIDRDGKERIALGGIEFENSDLFALLEGAAARLRGDYASLQAALGEIRKTLDNKTMDEKTKLREISWITIKNHSSDS